MVFDCNIQKQNLNMSVLKQKLDKAADLFQTHQFKEALAAYEDSLAFCYRTREAQTLIFNIMTTKAALQSILGQQEAAMTTLNEVLRTDPNHYLAMIRRSQVYKKGKFNRALKDLQTAATFCPDNLQVTAMKIEIETMKSKNKNSNSSQESQSEQEFDEELQLNFSNLKTIDRKSCSIMIDPVSKRKSRVTISGDTAFEYEAEDNADKSNNSTSISKEQSKEIYLRTSKEIQMENDVPAPASKVVAKPNPRSKSILKNKQTPSLINSIPVQDQKEIYGGRESRFVENVKNIDGKMITSSHSIGSEKGLREVEFRKSLFASQQKQFKPVEVPQIKVVNKSGRKSCLKRSSFESLQQQAKERPVRKSKFESLSRNSIDGIVIKNRKSIDNIKEISNDKVEKASNDDDSDQGSSYNIFGSNENVVISKQIKQKLGLNKVDNKESKGPAKPRAGGGKSILKKGSVLLSNEPEKPGKSIEVKETNEEKGGKKPKKSVMFTKSRFAE